MYAPGHVGLALLAFAPIGYRLARTEQWRRLGRWLPVTVLCGLLPDIDLYLTGVGHRMITHTLVAAVLLAVVLGVVGRLVQATTRGVGQSFTHDGAAGALLGVGSHLAGDLVTPMGIAPVLPLSTTRVTLDLVAARDPTANTALLAAGIVAIGLVGIVEGSRRRRRDGWSVDRRSRSAAWSSRTGDK